ncbi:unnamed protein product, partial [Ectocarpus sp. 12 AP-2014]
SATGITAGFAFIRAAVVFDRPLSTTVRRRRGRRRSSSSSTLPRQGRRSRCRPRRIPGRRSGGHGRPPVLPVQNQHRAVARDRLHRMPLPPDLDRRRHQAAPQQPPLVARAQ